MIVQHNLLSNFTQRELKISTGQKAKSTEKLSSGYRINRSADDAAGLSISEKMRWNIRGLDKATDNIQDGHSFCQVADGAMGEIEDILHRMKELTIQGANDTNTASDRDAIQKEINQLSKEIDRTTSDTDFNTLKVFGMGRREEVISKSTGKKISTKTIIVQDTTQLGLREILGEDKIWKENRLNCGLDFLDSGWKSTGEELFIDPSNGRVLDKKGVLDSIKKIVGNDAPTELYFHDNSYSTGSGRRYNIDGSVVDVMFRYDSNYRTLDGDKIAKTIEVSKGHFQDGTNIYEKDKTLAEFILSDAYDGGSNVHGSTGYNQGLGYGSAWIDFSELGTKYQLKDLYGHGFNTYATADTYCNIRFTGEGAPSSYSKEGQAETLNINISGCSTGEDIVKKIYDALNESSNKAFLDHYTQYAYNDSEPAKLYIYDNGTFFRNDTSGSLFEPIIRGSGGEIIIDDIIVEEEDVIRKYSDSDIWIQSGSKNMSGFFIERPFVNSSILGVSNLSVSDYYKASCATAAVDRAVNYLNAERTKMGVQMNRLETAAKIDRQSSENTSTAESRIRDTDMAKEMVNYSKHNIVEQVGQNMLAQANQSTQGVLSLLS